MCKADNVQHYSKYQTNIPSKAKTQFNSTIQYLTQYIIPTAWYASTRIVHCSLSLYGSTRITHIKCFICYRKKAKSFSVWSTVTARSTGTVHISAKWNQKVHKRMQTPSWLTTPCTYWQYFYFNLFSSFYLPGQKLLATEPHKIQSIIVSCPKT